MESSPPPSSSSTETIARTLPPATQPAASAEGPPVDWPAPGEPIDLVVHDLPHASSVTEWWYTNVHLTLADGREVSLFAAFFRMVVGRDEKTLEPIHAHSITWGLSDLRAEEFIFDTVVDPMTPAVMLERMSRPDLVDKTVARDARVRRALQEMLERGQVPYPDHMLSAAPHCGTRRLELELDRNRFVKTDRGNYRLSLWHDHWKAGVELELVPPLGKPAVRHGDDGVVRGPDGADMFYYFMPDLSASGHVVLGGQRLAVTDGRAWYDHEFGGHRQDGAESAEEVAWNWCALQLDDGSQVTAYAIVDVASGRSLVHRAIWVEADGTRVDLGAFDFEPTEEWRSKRSFNTYPIAWRLDAPEHGLAFEIRAAFPDQEIVTVISKGMFWEGRVDAVGARAGRPVAGRGYVERSGFVAIQNLEGFFDAVGREVRKSVADLLPFEPTFEQVRDLVASEERAHYMEGVDVGDFVKYGVVPVRAITDRGGKGWRSYASLACCDVVGGDSRKYVKWLAMPELMHVGSLIVDDVQDRSTVRRGGPAVHVVHGDALAINAGTSCYFMGQRLLHGTEVSNAQKLQLYDLYFEALRAGHAGQAFDLAGLAELMPAVVATGETRVVEQRIVAVYRLKTGAPAGALARMGALVGGGSEAQIEGVGRYFESLGIAFQMIDDVLNLRGFAGDLKTRGEDVATGKVTLPLVLALGDLTFDEREWLWRTIEGEPQDAETIAKVIALIGRGGGLERTERRAVELVEGAWQALDPLLEPSFVKLMLRAFGWFVLERHY